MPTVRAPSTYSDAALAAWGAEADAIVQTVRASYDFTKQGGAIGTIALSGGALPIPSGAVIIGGYVDVSVQLQGATATIACQVEAANDILTAVAVASWTTGRKNVLPAETTGALTAGTEVKTTAARDISIVIATAALTAGAFDVVLQYQLRP
jgi:hypothetical protein